MADPVDPSAMSELERFVEAIRFAHAGNVPRARLGLWLCGDLEMWDAREAGLYGRGWQQLEMWRAA